MTLIISCITIMMIVELHAGYFESISIEWRRLNWTEERKLQYQNDNI